MKIELAYKEYLIKSKREIAPETYLIKLKGEFIFEPGQFLQVYVDNIGEATFAPCSDSEDHKNIEICVRTVGNTTRAVAELNPGEKLKIRGPYGKGWPIGKLIGQNIAIISGGIGLIPLRPLLYQLQKYPKEFKNIYLLSGCRTPHHLPFREDKWRFKYQKITAEKTIPDFESERGMITELVEKVDLPKDTRILICGPEIMFQPLCDILNDKKINDKNIYISFERRMECGIGFCQHCSIGKFLVCKDGPVFRWDIIKNEMNK